QSAPAFAGRKRCATASVWRRFFRRSYDGFRNQKSFQPRAGAERAAQGLETAGMGSDSRILAAIGAGASRAFEYLLRANPAAPGWIHKRSAQRLRVLACFDFAFSGSGDTGVHDEGYRF